MSFCRLISRPELKRKASSSRFFETFPARAASQQAPAKRRSTPERPSKSDSFSPNAWRSEADEDPIEEDSEGGVGASEEGGEEGTPCT